MLAEAEVLVGPYNRWWDREGISPVYTEKQRALDAGEPVSDSSETEVEQELEIKETIFEPEPEEREEDRASLESQSETEDASDYLEDVSET
jgi:hypothetical protein